MSMHWNTYLVRLNPDVNGMDAWQERMPPPRHTARRHLLQHRAIGSTRDLISLPT